jgi:hypothetical protein
MHNESEYDLSSNSDWVPETYIYEICGYSKIGIYTARVEAPDDNNAFGIAKQEIERIASAKVTHYTVQQISKA